jgi:subtilisin family serine protease
MFPRLVSRRRNIGGARWAALPGLVAACAALALGAAGAAAADGSPVSAVREAAAGPAPADQGTGVAPDRSSSIDDRVIVQWERGTGQTERAEARADAGVTPAAELGDPRFQLVEVEDGSADAAAAALEADPAVAVAEPDGFRRLEAIPNDPLFAQQWGLRNTGQAVAGPAAGTSGNDIDVVDAWDRTVGTPSTVVADIDSGYRADSPDLGPVEWTNPGEIPGNGKDDDGNGYVDDVHGWDFVGENAQAPTADNDPTDSNLVSGGHGVHTAGIIGAAGNNGTGISGVAQDIRMMPLRVCTNEPSLKETRCPTSAIIAAINYAGANGARVANLSLGGTVYSQLEANAFAANPGTLYVISAGNDAANNDSGGSGTSGHHYPCDYRPGVESSPVVPGAIENTICVAALDPSGALASYSDYGTTSVDLGAPGTAVLSTLPATETLFSDNFETNDFATRWAVLGNKFGRTNESPLTSFGIADTPGAAPEANHIYGVELASPVAVPAGTGACRLEGKRFRRGGGQFGAPYGVKIDGTYEEFNGGETSGSAMTAFRTVPIVGLGGHSVKPFFEYRATAAPSPTDGSWLDDLALNCNAPLSTPPTYAFEDGTSMAAPQVSGAAALLFSLKATATVTEVREALLNSVSFAPALKGKVATGGKLDVTAAMNVLVPPTITITEGPSGATTATGATFKFTTAGFAASPVTNQCSLDGAPFTPCSSPATYGSLAVRAHEFRVSAADGTAGGVADTARAWTVEAPPSGGGGGGSTGPGTETHPPVISFPLIEEHVVKANPAAPTEPAARSQPTTAGCTVPKLAGKTLGAAKAALSAAGCKLGKVTSPKVPRGSKPPKLIVKATTPAAGNRTAGAVGIRLAAKPRRHHH